MHPELGNVNWNPLKLKAFLQILSLLLPEQNIAACSEMCAKLQKDLQDLQATLYEESQKSLKLSMELDTKVRCKMQSYQILVIWDNKFICINASLYTVTSKYLFCFTLGHWGGCCWVLHFALVEMADQGSQVERETAAQDRQFDLVD